MNSSSQNILRIALLAAGYVVAGGAVAASDGSGVAPSREAVQQAGQQPDARSLDDNAQRQHDRNQARSPERNGQKSSDSSGVAPSRQMIEQQGMQPDARALDDNAQRQHDRNQGVERHSGPTAADRKAMSQPGPTGYAHDDFIESEMNSQGTTRNWKKIDRNNDGSISPEEMESSLQQSTR